MMGGIWEEEGQLNSERRDGLYDEIGSVTDLESMYSPPRPMITDRFADQMQFPPLDLVGLQSGLYSPPIPMITDWVADHVPSPPLDFAGFQSGLYSPPGPVITDWIADQVPSPPLDLFGLQSGLYSPPRPTITDWFPERVPSPPLDLFGLQSGLYSPPRPTITDWIADQVPSPPLDLFGLQSGLYSPPRLTINDWFPDQVPSPPLDLFGLQGGLYSPPRPMITDWFTDQVPSPLANSFFLCSLQDLTVSNCKLISMLPDRGLHLEKPINAQATIYSQPCKLNFVGAHATGIYLTVQCFKVKQSNAQGFFLEGRYTEAFQRSDIKYFFRFIKKFMTWLDSLEEKMVGALGAKYIEQKVESAKNSCIATSHLKGKGSTERPKRMCRAAYLITLDDLRQFFGIKRADAAKTLGGCWIEVNHILQFLKVVKSNNAQGYSLEGRYVKANNRMDKKLNSGAQYNQTSQRRPGVEIIQQEPSEEHIFGELGAKNIGQKVERAEKICIAISHSKNKDSNETPKRKYRTKRTITLEDLQQHFGQKRKDAAKTLGVSVPTFKRYCRQNGITWWNGDGCSLIEPKLLNDFVQQNPLGPKPPELQREKETSVLLGVRQDAVTVKAIYGKHIARFQLPSGVVELKEAVAKRLELEVDGFYVEYQDDDQEWVLISCNEDLQDCVKFSSSVGNQVIRLQVTAKIPNSENSRKSRRGLKRKSS